MNYVSHLNTVFRRFADDPKLNPTHISLYIALFQIWNLSRFAAIIYINREEIMKMSKIGSLATYHRCLKQLHQGKYIVYLPSHNPFKGSQIKFLKFETTCGTSSENSTETTSEKSDVQVQERVLVHKENNKKTLSNFYRYTGNLKRKLSISLKPKAGLKLKHSSFSTITRQ